MIPLLLACASDTPHWAINVVSAVPTANGIAGTQVWQFFDEGWGKAGEQGAYVCARVQTFTGTGTSMPPACSACLAAYELVYEEMASDCDTALAEDPAFELPVTIAIGDPATEVETLDPHAGRSMGWYTSFDGAEHEPYGFVWDDALDYGGTAGPPGWNDGQAYTLWPAYAWDLAGAAG